jgi:hypothetical protein
MKKLLAYILAFMTVCLVSHSFAATYDATGAWTAVNSNFWIKQGNSGDCGDDTPSKESLTISQNGNSFTATIQKGALSGTISGADYYGSLNYGEDGGTSTLSIDISLTSATSASGTVEWYWTDGYYYCEGGHDVSLTKDSSGGTSANSYDATGKWTFDVSDPVIDQGNSGNCTGLPAHIDVVTINQTGGAFSATNDAEGRTYSGTVSGATYSGSASYTNKGGDVTEYIEINLSSATSGSGTGEWRWSDGTYYCSGNYTMTATKSSDNGTGSDSGGGDRDGGGGGGGGCFISATAKPFPVSRNGAAD